jgi:glycosyltransferase involved in cell wall biosynthesis
MEIADQKYIGAQYFTPQPAVRILHIIKSLGRGGAELLLPESLRKHDKEKFEFHYLYFLPWKNQVVNEIEHEGGVVVCFPAKNNIGILMSVRKIVHYVKTHHIQLIHCHLPWAGIVGRVAGRITGIPVVYTEHNKWERYHPLTYFMNKLSFSAQQKVVAVSGEVARSIKAHYTKEKPAVQVVLNGTDTDKFSVHRPFEPDVRLALNIPAHATVIGITCVFRVQKRLPVWLEIASLLHAKHPDVYFIIVGDGVLHEEVHQQARVLGTGEYVHFAGLQTDTRPWLKAMDIFMMSSEFEGLPVALLEAMSMGCMPACTDAGGIPDVIQNNVNGILVPVASPLQLADRLSALLLHPDRIAAMKKAARDRVVRHFSMQGMVNQLETIYDSLTLHQL